MDQAQQPALSHHPTPIPIPLTQMWYYLNYDDAHLHISWGGKYLFATENRIRKAKTSVQKRLTLRGGKLYGGITIKHQFTADNE